jgi:hypothetical protein
MDINHHFVNRFYYEIIMNKIATFVENFFYTSLTSNHVHSRASMSIVKVSHKMLLQ